MAAKAAHTSFAPFVVSPAPDAASAVAASGAVAAAAAVVFEEGGSGQKPAEAAAGAAAGGRGVEGSAVCVPCLRVCVCVIYAVCTCAVVRVVRGSHTSPVCPLCCRGVFPLFALFVCVMCVCVLHVCLSCVCVSCACVCPVCVCPVSVCVFLLCVCALCVRVRYTLVLLRCWPTSCARTHNS